MNLGQLTSMTKCNSCGFDIFINPLQENIICEHCGRRINLTTISILGKELLNKDNEGENEMKESTIDMTIKNATYRGEEIVDVRILKLNPNAIIPTYAHDTDSGMDIFAMEDVIIQPHETVAIPTGIAIALPKCYELQIRPKSGNSLKTKLRIANSPSTIDEGYRGDIGIICDNIGDTPIEIKKGKAICQGVLRFVPKINWVEVNEFTDVTDRGTGAYGSSNRGI